MSNIAEVKARADIGDVWSALGGGKLRRGRGQAWWRGGDGYSVSLDLARGLWHDFVSGDGGDVVTLVTTVRQCTFPEAVEWLSQHTGIPISGGRATTSGTIDTEWRGDLERATYWAMAAEALTELALEDLPPWHPDRLALTKLLASIRLGDASLVGEFRQWRQRHPQMTAALAHAGRLHDARVQRRLAHWLRRYVK